MSLMISGNWFWTDVYCEFRKKTRQGLNLKLQSLLKACIISIIACFVSFVSFLQDHQPKPFQQHLPYLCQVLRWRLFISAPHSVVSLMKLIGKLYTHTLQHDIGLAHKQTPYIIDQQSHLHPEKSEGSWIPVPFQRVRGREKLREHIKNPQLLEHIGLALNKTKTVISNWALFIYSYWSDHFQ